MLASPRFHQLRRAIDQSHHVGFKEALPTLSTARLGRRSFIQGVGSSLAVGLSAQVGWAQSNQKSPRIAIIGAGLAGLSAAYYLEQRGLIAQVYEGLNRVGGRVLTSTSALGTGTVVDLGAELVNTDHDEILELAKRFRLELLDRNEKAKAPNTPDEAFLIQGQLLSEAKLAQMIGPLAIQVGADAAKLADAYELHARRIDALSIAQYLDSVADLSLPARVMVEASIRTEYGIELHEASALQLLFNLPLATGNQVDLVSGSDESYVFAKGTGSLPDAMASHLGERIQLEHILKRLTLRSDGGYVLDFDGKESIEADYVILTGSPPALREVELNVPLTNPIGQTIKQGNLGRNEKVVARYQGSPWSEVGVFEDSVWSDTGFAQAWDTSQRFDNISDSALIFYLGGNQVSAAGGDAEQEALRFTLELNRVIPNIEDKLAGQTARSHWAENPLIGGSYSSFKPGQITSEDRITWIEERDSVTSSVRSGNLLFAGEYWSDSFNGFMNGAVETGRLAARVIAGEVS